MELEFRHHAASGRVAVDVCENTNPAELGCDAASIGLPVCTARVETAAQGTAPCAAGSKWCAPQTTRLGEKASTWTPSPRRGTDSPYAFYGLAPTLFDAPGRDHRNDLDWLAHAFLAHTPLGANTVEAVLGFSWGFRFRADEVQIVGPAPLHHADWAAHQELLTAEHPAWTFPAMSAT